MHLKHTVPKCDEAFFLASLCENQDFFADALQQQVLILEYIN